MKMHSAGLLLQSNKRLNAGTLWAVLRRRPQFSLRSLLIAVLLIGCGIGAYLRWTPWVRHCVITGALRVTTASFSSDGRHILTTSFDNTAGVWDAQNGTRTVQLLGHTKGILSGAFSPDGNRVVTAGLDCTVRVWDALNGHELKCLSQVFYPEKAAWSPDSKHLAIIDHEVVMLWSTDIWCCEVQLKHDGKISGLAYSPDGKRIVTAEKCTRTRPDGLGIVQSRLSLWDKTGNKLVTIDLTDGSIDNIAFSPDGRCIVVDGEQDQIRDANTLRPIHSINGIPYVDWGFESFRWVLHAKFSPDGSRVMGVSEDALLFWDPRNSAPLLRLDFKDVYTIRSVNYSLKGDRFVIAGDGLVTQIWINRRSEGIWGLTEVWIAVALILFEIGCWIRAARKQCPR